MVSTSYTQRLNTSAMVFFFRSTIPDFSQSCQNTVSLVLVSHRSVLKGVYLPWHFHCQNNLIHNHQKESGVPKLSCLQHQEKTKNLKNFLFMSLPLKEDYQKLFRTFFFLNTLKAYIFEKNLTWHKNNLQKNYDSPSLTWKRTAAYPTNW